jgi:hypothetical protein
MKHLFTAALAGAALTALAGAQGGTWTQSVNNTTMIQGGVSCNAGGPNTDNSYWRKYDPITCGLTTDYVVKSCTFAVEISTWPDPASPGMKPVTVNIRMANGSWPAGGSVDPIIQTAMALVPDTVVTDQRFVTAMFVTPAIIPAGTCIAVEVFAPDGTAIGGNYFPGSNPLGQTAPSYISATPCGVPDPADLAALGFPNVHMIIDLDCNPAGPPPITYICDPANANTTGQPANLLFQGNNDISQGPYLALLTTTQLPPNQFGYYLASRTPRVPGLPVSNGRLCLQGDIARLIGPGQPGVQNSGPNGVFQAAVNTANVPTNPNRAILPGDTWYFQAWYRDQSATGPRSNFSNACCVPFF